MDRFFNLSLVHIKTDTSIVQTSLLAWMFGGQQKTELVSFDDNATISYVPRTDPKAANTTSVYIESAVTVITKRPKQLITIFSEIAGMLVVLKAAFIITIVHKFMFNRKIKNNQTFKSMDDKDFKELFSFNNLKETMDKVKEMEMEIRDLKELVIQNQKDYIQKLAESIGDEKQE